MAKLPLKEFDDGSAESCSLNQVEISDAALAAHEIEIGDEWADVE
jgi:hypothetical protein